MMQVKTPASACASWSVGFGIFATPAPEKKPPEKSGQARRRQLSNGDDLLHTAAEKISFGRGHIQIRKNGDPAFTITVITDPTGAIVTAHQ